MIIFIQLFLLFTLDIFFLNSDPPVPLYKKHKFININKTKTKPKTDTKNQVGKTVPKVQIGQTSSSIIIDTNGCKENIYRSHSLSLGSAHVVQFASLTRA